MPSILSGLEERFQCPSKRILHRRTQLGGRGTRPTLMIQGPLYNELLGAHVSRHTLRLSRQSAIRTYTCSLNVLCGSFFLRSCPRSAPHRLSSSTSLGGTKSSPQRFHYKHMYLSSYLCVSYLQSEKCQNSSGRCQPVCETMKSADTRAKDKVDHHLHQMKCTKLRLDLACDLNRTATFSKFKEARFEVVANSVGVGAT